MATNRYFRGNLPQSEMAKVYKVITGFPNQQFVYDNGKKILVMLHLGDEGTHPSLNSFTEIDKAEAQQITEQILT